VAGRGGNRSRLLLVILLVTSLFLITLDLRGVSLTKSSRSATQSFLSPIQRGVSSLFSPVGNFFSDIKNFGKTKAELTATKAANAKLQRDLILSADMKGQLAKLRGALNLAGHGGYKVVSARVIGHGSASTFSQTITIDVGTADGITSDMTVMGSTGIVGVVKVTTAHSSVVELMSDPNFKVGVRIAGTQSIGVVLGQGDAHFVLQLLDPAGNIKVGDSLVSLGSDGNRPFVAGVPVGRVSAVNNSGASLTQEADVLGFENLNDLGVVTVIVAPPAHDPRDSLIPTPEPTVTVWVTATAAPGTAPSAPATSSITPIPAPTPSATSVKKKTAK
jgi:rod shape-determining protein MreC